MKSIFLEDSQFITCEVTSNVERTKFTGVLSYKGFENGTITGTSLEEISSQYRAICSLSENEGAMLRRGTIMMGYHNGILKGDVLLLDGEIIGRWEMEEDDDWSRFFPQGQIEAAYGAPSAWLLQDAIADWLEREVHVLDDGS